MSFEGGSAVPWVFPILFPMVFMLIMMSRMMSSRSRSPRRGGPMGMMGGMMGGVNHGSADDADDGNRHSRSGGGERGETPLEVAQRRYASGEISREEFQRIREDL